MSKKSIRLKFLIRDPLSKAIVCGMRYDVEKSELLIGGTKATEEERERFITMLNIFLGEVKVQREDKNDGYKTRIRIKVSKGVWKSFVNRTSRLYIFEQVKSFRRLMN